MLRVTQIVCGESTPHPVFPMFLDGMHGIAISDLREANGSKEKETRIQSSTKPMVSSPFSSSIAQNGLKGSLKPRNVHQVWTERTLVALYWRSEEQERDSYGSGMVESFLVFFFFFFSFSLFNQNKSNTMTATVAGQALKIMREENRYLTTGVVVPQVWGKFPLLFPFSSWCLAQIHSEKCPTE